MTKILKKCLYWCSLVCPIFDLVKVGLSGAAKGLQSSIDEYDRKLEEKIREQLNAEIQRQRAQMFNDSLTEDEKNVG